MIETNRTKTQYKGTKNLGSPIIISILLLFVTVIFFSAQTYAYFFDNESTGSNQIKTGSANVEILEVQNPDDGEVSNTTPLKFLPGARIHKDIKIVNSGELPIYARIKIEKTIINTENNIPDDWENLISCNFNPDDPSTSTIENYWIYLDGYYYYYNQITPSTITASLFDEIYFSEAMGNEFTNTMLEFKIICQAVQANGNSDNPLTAWGWPTDSTEEAPETTAEASETTEVTETTNPTETAEVTEISDNTESTDSSN